MEETQDNDSKGWSSEDTADDGSFRPASSNDEMLRWLVPVGRSAWAIAAGYLGLACILLYPAPLAIIAGLLGIRDIRANPKKHGLMRAWFGIVSGILGLIGLVLWKRNT